MTIIASMLENKDLFEVTKAKGVSIGDKFIPKHNNKQKLVYIVSDIYTVINSKGKIVEYQFWTEHDFLGQKVKVQFPAATIVRSGIIKNEEN